MQSTAVPCIGLVVVVVVHSKLAQLAEMAELEVAVEGQFQVAGAAELLAQAADLR